MNRRPRWNRILTGAVAGCPGLDDQAPPPGTESAEATRRSGPEPEREAGPSRQRAVRSAWISAAAVLLVVQGVLGFVYAPMLAGGGSIEISPTVLLVWALAAANTATGLGLLRLQAWARVAAGTIAAGSLLLVDVPGLLSAAERGAALTADVLGLLTSLIVLFAVLRRWPGDPERSQRSIRPSPRGTVERAERRASKEPR